MDWGQSTKPVPPSGRSPSPLPHHRPSPRLERAVTGTHVFWSAVVPHRQTGGAVGSEGGESGRVVLGCLCKRFGPSLGRFAGTRPANVLAI